MSALNEPRILNHAVIPACILLYGLLFCLGVSYFSSVQWESHYTKVFYGVLMMWGGYVVWCRRRQLASSASLGDVWGGLFLLMVLASLGFRGAELRDSIAHSQFQYVPFLMVLPYLVGRVSRQNELATFLKCIEWVGPVSLVLAAINYWISPETVLSNRRWVFFGYDHTPLLLGFALAGSLIAMSFRMLGWRAASELPSLPIRVVSLMLFSGCLVSLVLITARGALFAALIAMLLLLLTVRDIHLKKKLMLIGAVVSIVVTTFWMLPKSQGQMYAQLDTSPAVVQARALVYEGVFGHPEQARQLAIGPVLGEASCSSWKDGMNSVAMRWVVYLEAWELFKYAPVMGVGSGRFGIYSCTGSGGFPHSTFLHAMAELGVVGGGALMAMVAGCFLTLFAAVRNYRDPRAPVLLAFMTFYVVTDQIYGNYFMSVGTYFFVGLAGALRNDLLKEVA